RPCSSPLPAPHSFPTRRASDLLHRSDSPLAGAVTRSGRDQPVATGAPGLGGPSGSPGGTVQSPPLVKMRMSASCAAARLGISSRSEEHTSELQSRENLVCRLLL